MSVDPSKPKKIEYISMRLVTDALLRRGFTVRDLGLKPRFLEFTSPEGWKWLTRYGFVSYPFVSLAVGQIAGNKRRSYAFAEVQGAAIPRTLLLPRDEAGLDGFLRSYAPLVVKPLDSFSSKGMQLNITTAAQLRQAIQSAQEYSEDVLVQQQFHGSEIRFTVLNGHVAHCLVRETPRVVGDESSTVAELIVGENLAREELHNQKVPYPQLDETIIPPRNLQDSTVLKMGEVLELNKSTLVAGGAVMRNVTDQVHPSYKQIAADLAAALNPPFLAVDLLVTDWQSRATADNYVFLEFTIAPSLRLYYDVRSGEDFDIAEKLADMIEDWGKR